MNVVWEWIFIEAASIQCWLICYYHWCYRKDYPWIPFVRLTMWSQFHVGQTLYKCPHNIWGHHQYVTVLSHVIYMAISVHPRLRRDITDNDVVARAVPGITHFNVCDYLCKALIRSIARLDFVSQPWIEFLETKKKQMRSLHISMTMPSFTITSQWFEFLIPGSLNLIVGLVSILRLAEILPILAASILSLQCPWWCSSAELSSANLCLILRNHHITL